MAGSEKIKRRQIFFGRTYLKLPVAADAGSSIQKTKEIILAPSGKKINFDKTKQKTIVTKAEYGEATNEISGFSSINNENESAEKRANLPRIIPEPIINLRQDNSLKKFFLPTSYYS